MKRYTENVHLNAMLDAQRDLKTRQFQRTAGRLLPITFMVGWLVVLLAAMVN